MKLQYSKQTKTWRPVAVLQPKEYSYIPELLVKIFKRIEVPGLVTQVLRISDNDPHNIAPCMASAPKPTIQEAMKSNQSRFGK